VGQKFCNCWLPKFSLAGMASELENEILATKNNSFCVFFSKICFVISEKDKAFSFLFFYSLVHQEFLVSCYFMSEKERWDHNSFFSKVTKMRSGFLFANLAKEFCAAFFVNLHRFS